PRRKSLSVFELAEKGKNLDAVGMVIHPRALPVFDTMPELDREAVIEAVAPLRGLERDHWPSAGAREVPGIPLTYLVPVGQDLGVLVSQMEDKRVEVLDIVRLASLAQFAKPGEGDRT